MEYNNIINIGKKEGAREFLSSMNRPMDIEYNNEGSTYICENYNKLIAYVRAFCGNKVVDPAEIVNEVWYSIKRSEDMGEGYNVHNGENGIITVEQFVYGRLKKYCLGTKYKTYGAVVRNADEGDAVNGSIYDCNGERKVIKNKNAIVELPAYTSEELNLVYENASDSRADDAFGAVDDFEAIHNYVEELFNYGDELNMKSFVKNLAQICRENTSTLVLQRMFKDIIQFTKEQDLFRESLFQVITFAIKYPNEYQVMVANL